MLQMNNFIEEYKTPDKICNGILKYFKDNKKKQVKGKCRVNNETVADPKVKVSTDITIPVNSGIKLFDEYNQFLIKCVHRYIKKYPDLDKLDLFGLTEGYNIQYYKKNQGFKIWHSERSINTLSRMMVFMTYLNDVPDGGTHFRYYNLTTKAKKGTTLLWPSDFTHTHKGQISKKYSKYIVTGWMSFVKNVL